MKENLREILMGGQTFSWREESGVFSAALNGKVYRIKTIEDCYYDPFLRTYFDLDYDYDKAYCEIKNKDEVLNRAVEKVGRLRILKQDEWTSAISFILSQNNNIKRITSLYNKLSAKYGKEVEEGYYLFPTPLDLDGVKEEDLRNLGLGFRAPYVIDAIEKKDIFEEVKEMDFSSAMINLQKIKGIGVKVASCILIFGYGRKEGFPIDTWMRQCLEKYYPGINPDLYFSPYQALSQQYLFSYMRSGE